MGVREEADAGEEERQRPGRVEAYQKEKEQKNREREKAEAVAGQRKGATRPRSSRVVWHRERVGAG